MSGVLANPAANENRIMTTKHHLYSRPDDTTPAAIAPECDHWVAASSSGHDGRERGGLSFAKLTSAFTSSLRFAAIALGALAAFGSTAQADETCSSPYLARIEGQEEFLYVWTLGVEGLGDGVDKLVTVDVKPGSASYGKVINSHSLAGRFEAHHGGFTDDRRQLWLCGLDGSKIFIFDVYSQPDRPRLVKTIENFEQATGGVAGPHGAYALPGRVLVPCLSNARDKGGRTALVEYSNEGDYITTH